MARQRREPRRREFRVARLVAAKASLLDDLSALAAREDGTPLFEWGVVADLRRQAQQMALRVERLCREADREPADLPAPSRRAFQLVSFLGSDGRLEAHLDTLRRLSRVDRRLEVRLDHIGGLYRIERGPEGIRLEVSEGFVGAPQPVVEALARLAIPYARKRKPRQVVADFADGEAFSLVLRQVEDSGGASASRPEGAYYNLAELFERINRACFGGRLEAPRLAWTERQTAVEFGHYEPATDTVRISRSLDSPDVPPFVLEHVMHHELLHRHLGARRQGGRRRFHTPQFRRAERRFPGYAEAAEFLQRLAGDVAADGPGR